MAKERETAMNGVERAGGTDVGLWKTFKFGAPSYMD